MGFNHIYLYDNNREDEEQLSSVLTEVHLVNESTHCGHTDEYCLSPITIVPLHHRSYVQMYAYQDCYINGHFDWLLFIDIDEFFTFADTGLQLEEWVEKTVQPKSADAILINWMCYGDCGHIRYTDIPVADRFSRPLPYWFSPTNAFGKAPENRHIKTMIRKGADFTIFNPHVGKGNYKTVNPDGIEVPNAPQQKEYTFNTAYLRHYVTKTIEEYALQKSSGRLRMDRRSIIHYGGFLHIIKSLFLRCSYT